MFGYVTPAKPEMKVKEFESYRAMYCGLCKQLKKDYGFWPRMLLNYDLVTVALLADGISGEQGSPCMERCIANPIKKRCMQKNTQGLQLAAAGLVLLSWYKLADDLADEPFLKRQLVRILRLLLRSAYKKAAKQYLQIDRVLAQQTERQQQIECSKTKRWDEAAEPTGVMTAEILAACAESEQQERILRRMGLFLGKILYWLDAAEDYEADQEKHRYNVFLQNEYSKQQTIEQVQLQCRLAAGEVARCYNLLDIKLNRPILDNIIFLGLPASIERAGIATNVADKRRAMQ